MLVHACPCSWLWQMVVYAVTRTLRVAQLSVDGGGEKGVPVTIGDNVWLGGGEIVCPAVCTVVLRGESTVLRHDSPWTAASMRLDPAEDHGISITAPMCCQPATVCLTTSPARQHRVITDLPARLATSPDSRDQHKSKITQTLKPPCSGHGVLSRLPGLAP